MENWGCWRCVASRVYKTLRNHSEDRIRKDSCGKPCSLSAEMTTVEKDCYPWSWLVVWRELGHSFNQGKLWTKEQSLEEDGRETNKPPWWHRSCSMNFDLILSTLQHVVLMPLYFVFALTLSSYLYFSLFPLSKCLCVPSRSSHCLCQKQQG